MQDRLTSFDYLYEDNGDLCGFYYSGTPYLYVQNGQNDINRNTWQYRHSSGKLCIWYLGELLITTGTLASAIGELNHFRYRDYYFDTESGLYYLQSRYYDAATQRGLNTNDAGIVTAQDIVIFPLDISLYVKGTDTKVQPNAGTSVTITCPIPESLLATKDKIKVVCLFDGKLTILDTKIVLIDGVYCVQFSATHFSPYAMVIDTNNELSNKATNPKTQETSNSPIITFTFLAIFTTITLAVVNKKRKFKVVKKG